MKTKLSAIGITNASGKAGGTIASRNRFGTYVKNFAVPTNPSSPAQMVVRTRFGTLSANWRTLTETDRAAWNAATINFPQTDVFGDEYIPTGKDLFVLINMNLGTIALPTVDLPPTKVTVFDVSGVQFDLLNASGPDYELEFIAPVPPLTSFIVVQSTGNISPGISFFKNLTRQMTVFTGNGVDSTIPVLAPFVARYGPLIEGERVGAAVYAIMSNGQAGPKVFLDQLVNP